MARLFDSSNVLSAPIRRCDILAVAAVVANCSSARLIAAAPERSLRESASCGTACLGERYLWLMEFNRALDRWAGLLLQLFPVINVQRRRATTDSRGSGELLTAWSIARAIANTNRWLNRLLRCWPENNSFRSAVDFLIA